MSTTPPTFPTTDASPVEMAEGPANDPGRSGVARVFRSIWASLIWLVILMIPIQFYLAGHGAFEFHNASATGREDAWGAHAAFGSLIGIVVLLTLLSSFAARLPRRLLGMTGLLFVLMLIQIILAGFGDSVSTRWIAALHPVNALILTGVVIMLAVRSRAYLPIARLRPTSQ